MPEKLCELIECNKPARARSKYCKDEHRVKNARRAHEVRNADGPLSLDDRIERERHRLSMREEAKVLASLQRTEAKRREYIEVLRETLTPFEPSPLLVPSRPVKGAAPVEWGIDLSDWQVGQYTPIQSTGGLYEQTTEVAARQLDKVWEGLKSIYDVEIGGGMKTLRRLWLNFIGDLVDGDCLRPSQARQIDRVVTQQVLEVADLASLFIRRCLTLPGVEKIIIDMVGGNHDRTSQKAGNAGLGEYDFVDTYAWLIGHWLKRMFADDPRVEIVVWDTFFGYREFGGLYHAFEHGASFKGGAGAYGGIPWYPISNAAQQYTKMLVPEVFPRVDIVHMGHWHQPAMLPMGKGGWVLMNGALPVSSQFIQSSFKGIRAPLQWLVEYNLKHKWVNNVQPLYADVGQFKAGSGWDGENE